MFRPENKAFKELTLKSKEMGSKINKKKKKLQQLLSTSWTPWHASSQFTLRRLHKQVVGVSILRAVAEFREERLAHDRRRQ